MKYVIAVCITVLVTSFATAFGLRHYNDPEQVGSLDVYANREEMIPTFFMTMMFGVKEHDDYVWEYWRCKSVADLLKPTQMTKTRFLEWFPHFEMSGMIDASNGHCEGWASPHLTKLKAILLTSKKWSVASVYDLGPEGKIDDPTDGKPVQFVLWPLDQPKTASTP